MNLNELSIKAHLNAMRLGFYDKIQEDECILMRAIMQLSEAAYYGMKDFHAEWRPFNSSLNTWSFKSEDDFNGEYILDYESYMGKSIENSLASAVICLLDFMGYRKYNLEYSDESEQTFYTRVTEQIYHFIERITSVQIFELQEDERIGYINGLINDIIAYLDKVSDGKAEKHIEARMKYNELLPWKRDNDL